MVLLLAWQNGGNLNPTWQPNRWLKRRCGRNPQWGVGLGFGRWSNYVESWGHFPGLCSTAAQLQRARRPGEGERRVMWWLRGEMNCGLSFWSSELGLWDRLAESAVSSTPKKLDWKLKERDSWTYRVTVVPRKLILQRLSPTEKSKVQRRGRVKVGNSFYPAALCPYWFLTLKVLRVCQSWCEVT